MTSIAEWPIAAVTVRLDKAGERGPLEIPTPQIVELVTATISLADEGSKERLITKDYFDNEDAIMLGQDSSYGPRQFIIVPLDEKEPFFYLDRKYSGVRVLSHTWSGNRGMSIITNQNIILATRRFAASLELAYLDSITPSNRS